MTVKELSQLYYLNREAEDLRERLMELESLSQSVTGVINFMPSGGILVDKVSKYASQIADIKELIDINLRRCFCELKKINEFIGEIDDSEIREIFSLRYINGMSWQQIAYHLGFDGDGSTERKKHNRFLKRYNSLNSR